MKKRFLAGCLVGLVVLTSFSSLSVYADKKKTTEKTTETSTEVTTEGSTEATTESSKSQVSEEDKKKAEGTFKSSLGLSDEQLSVAKAMCAVLLADGFTAEATSGIVGNCFGECSFNSKAYAYDNSDKPNDVNGGLYGFTPIKDMVDSDGCWDGIKCNHEKFLYGDTKGSHKQQKACPDGGCQVAYMLKGVDAKFGWSGSYNKAWNTYIDDCKSKMTDADFFTKKLPENPTLAQLKAMTDWDSATVEFNICYEISYGNNVLIKKNKAYHDTTSSSAACHKYSSNKLKGAKACYDYLKAVGTVTADGSTDGSNILSTDADKQEAGNMAYALATNGYWSESQLGEFNQLYETQVTISGNRSDFTSKELTSISDWEQNVQKMNEKGSALYIVRVVTMIVGILFTVWMLLIYIAYWFDRLNNLVDIELLSILTLNKLRLSDTEESCDFRLSGLGKGEARTVNHRAILEICIIGVAFGALIISGYLYLVILYLVQKVIDFLH